MTVAVAILATLLLSVVTGALVLIRRDPGTPDEQSLGHGTRPRRREAMAAEMMLDLLPTAALIVDLDDNVRLANRAAVNLGLVRASSVDVAELRVLVRQCRHSRETESDEIVLERGGFPRREVTVRARAELLPDGDVALIVDDLTEAKRVESVRRDFVANVGHEIKTPVGALTLLTEAALDARDDPHAVQRFLERMHREAARLSRLVQEILDLSRLQGGEPLPDMEHVAIDTIVDEAIDRTRLVADAKQIDLVRGGEHGLFVLANEGQLVTAVSNLLDNAVSYSATSTRVAIGIHSRNGSVEVTVSDQGIGIAEQDQQRVFERFYRADPARSRETGGTGIGLAIVKHIVSNHGGEVSVWSQPGAGSTFTIRLPASTLLTTQDVPSGLDTNRQQEASVQ